MFQNVESSCDEDFNFIHGFFERIFYLKTTGKIENIIPNTKNEFTTN